MNPEKLFAYLDGNLDPVERSELESRLNTDAQLQREMTIAREIHKRARGESREVVFQDELETSMRGRKMALRVAMAFIVLIALNVAVGLIVIAHKESSNPNRKLLDAQMREQLKKSLEQATHSALTPPPLGVSDIAISVAPGKMNSVADQIVSTARRLGGSATKELPDEHSVGVLVDLAGDRETEFRAAIATITGGIPVSPPPNESGAPATEQKSFVVRVVEPVAAP